MWRTILESDILTQISGAELEAMRGVVLAEGQADPVQPCIDAVTSKVRGFVAGNAKNELDADATTIPDRLIDSAVSLIVVLIISRATMEPNETRKKLADDANRLLRDVASGSFSIADPTTGNEGSSSVRPAYIPTRRRQNFSSDAQGCL